MTIREINSNLKVECVYDESIDPQFNQIPDHAEYNGNNFSNAVRVERGITLEEAKKIAANDPEIGYFFIVKGECMILAAGENFNPENDPLNLVTYQPFFHDDGRIDVGYVRVFHQGDVVFFKNERKWLAPAPGLADVYEKAK